MQRRCRILDVLLLLLHISAHRHITLVSPPQHSLPPSPRALHGRDRARRRGSRVGDAHGGVKGRGGGRGVSYGRAEGDDESMPKITHTTRASVASEILPFDLFMLVRSLKLRWGAMGGVGEGQGRRWSRGKWKTGTRASSPCAVFARFGGLLVWRRPMVVGCVRRAESRMQAARRGGRWER
ncbi:hypothetical protein C8R46DRAFT_1115615 [Mycena filopes]|nr:hypothetical protein C8R46DRAFT_1115615 [Mycena filopes]